MGAAANPEYSRLAQYEVFSHRATDTNSHFVELRNSDTTRPFGRSQAIALEKPNEGPSWAQPYSCHLRLGQ